MERKCIREVLPCGYEIWCSIEQAGADLLLGVFGGDTPHIGSVVMSLARPSLTGEGTGVTSSVLNGIGHKDEEIARWFAEAAAVKRNCTVVCACGIHIDHITPEGLEQVKAVCRILQEKMMECISPVNP